MMLQRVWAKLRFELTRALNHFLMLLARLPAAGSDEKAAGALLQQMPPLFIIGAPRTGSTALYQIISHVFEVAYIDNLAANFYGNLPLALRLSRVAGGQGGHGCFESDLGRTGSGGWHAPHECGEFWYRWLSREEHYVEATDITPGMVAGLRREVVAATRALGRPLVFKNLNVGQRLQLIRRAFPEARILYCRREQAFTVQSILVARDRLGWPADALWSVRPKDWRTLERLPVMAQVAAQVVALERQIEDDLQGFPSAQVLAVDYEAWAGAESLLLDDLARFGGWARRPGASRLPGQRGGNRVRDPVQMKMIREALAAVPAVGNRQEK